MMDEHMTDDPQFPEAELARLADGSLPAAREAELHAELERSPELALALSEQERAIAVLRQAEVPAPQGLRTRVEEQARAATARRRQPRFRLGRLLPAATALAAGAAVVIVLLAGGGQISGPSLQQAALAALGAPTRSAPSEATGPANTLNATGAGIPFPYWQRSLGWRAVGARVDRLSGRSIVTVFYASPQGHRVGYTIVGGASVRVSGGVTVTRGGVAFTLLRRGSARLVTWLRSGHTCVIAGREVSDRTLLTLAMADVAPA